MQHSIITPFSLELKDLPLHLKYAYLGEGETLAVIISNELEKEQEQQLLDLLRDHKTAIGRTLADIKGISPSTCMHSILLEENSKPSMESQCCLNPSMMEVVKKEILKLLDVGHIYPITDSEWVSPVHVVLKKGGMTMVPTSDGGMMATRIQTGWRMCIDFRKLNNSTRKDHFSLPFMDQMLERLAGRSHYCFLDGYSGYNQNAISPEDQSKTTLSCSFVTFAYRRMPLDYVMHQRPSKGV